MKHIGNILHRKPSPALKASSLGQYHLMFLLGTRLNNSIRFRSGNVFKNSYLKSHARLFSVSEAHFFW